MQKLLYVLTLVIAAFFALIGVCAAYVAEGCGNACDWLVELVEDDYPG